MMESLCEFRVYKKYYIVTYNGGAEYFESVGHLQDGRTPGEILKNL